MFTKTFLGTSFKGEFTQAYLVCGKCKISNILNLRLPFCIMYPYLPGWTYIKWQCFTGLCEHHWMRGFLWIDDTLNYCQCCKNIFGYVTQKCIHKRILHAERENLETFWICLQLWKSIFTLLYLVMFAK